MRTILIGLDAFDPNTFEPLYEQGKLSNLGKYAETNKYRRFTVANPPQSEVSWTSIATGLNPGGHGLFDFVHRDPASYSLNVSLLPTKKGLGGTQFVPPYKALTIFDQVVRQGYQATALWWPAMFPARPESPVKTIPGLGTPDILGRLGVGSFFTSDADLSDEKDRKVPIYPVTKSGKGSFKSALHGPMRKQSAASTIDFELDNVDEGSGRLKIGKQVLDLKVGEWSPIVELSFKLGLFVSVKAVTRFILTKTRPEIGIYALPLQIHPLGTPWRYAMPRGFIKNIWRDCGPFLTLGWPQDTTALEEGYISEDQFLALCEDIDRAREVVLMNQIDNFEEGLLACVFDTLDRVQHMFWRDRADVIEAWYTRLDGMVGRIESRLKQRGIADDTRLLFVSDHGFSRFDHKVHLNRWLIDQGYLTPKNTHEEGDLAQADWNKSQAYAIGLNSVYLNLTDREGEGVVRPDERDGILNNICVGLEQWRGPDNKPVVQKAYRKAESLEGPLTEYGPDILVGFAPGYRASQGTGLGAWSVNSIEPNHDHWSADHCIDPEAVPGVIFANRDLANFPQPSYQDIPALAIDADPDSGGSKPPPTPMSSEDEKIIEERLRSLGYL